jgi:hypothetical protein
MVPDATEISQLEDLVGKLKVCNEVSIFLQQDNAAKVGLDIVRATFDSLIAEFPTMSRHLDKNSSIVHDKHFENAVVKVLKGAESSLSTSEKQAISVFRVDVTDVEEEEAPDADESFMTRVISSNRNKVAKKSNYRAMTHVSATSNAVERLFSRAKLVVTPQRGSMDPSTLETILVLRDNKDLWDVYMIQDIITRNDGRIPQNRVTTSAAPANALDEDDEWGPGCAHEIFG